MKDISYDHLRVFSCRAFVHVLKNERFKLDSKIKLCIFLGFCHEELGYIFWDPVDKKVIRSRDAVFLEDQTIVDFEKSEKPKINSKELVDLGMVRLLIVPIDDNRDI